MTRVLILVVAAFVVALLGGCGGARRSAGTPYVAGTPHVEVPASAQSYSTKVRSDGVRGGHAAADAEELLAKQLEARGDHAEPDGALADAAAWILQRYYRKEDMSASMLAHDAAIRFGFVGAPYGWTIVSQSNSARTIEILVAQLPKNAAVNRYGIVAGPDGRASIGLGSVQVTLEDFPRSLATGATLHLKGEVSQRYDRTSVHCTNPGGKVSVIPMTTRAIDASVTFPDRGVHKLEIIGHGEVGTFVLLNVPIYVGVPLVENTSPSDTVDPNLTADEAESILLSLLNEERTKHGLGKVEADAELRAVALAHSVDMTEHHFAGHVSPTTGTAQQRVAKAKLRLSHAAECIAVEKTPAGAHRGLLGSPAHRARMLDPGFTHVGIGVAFEDAAPGIRRIAVTLLFGRRPTTDDTKLSPAEIVEILQGLRRERKLPVLHVDPTLSSAAAAAADALKSGAAKDGEQALAASRRELKAATNRTGIVRTTCDGYLGIIDRYLLSEIPFLKLSEIQQIGVATAIVQSDAGPMLAVIVISDAGAGKVLTSCR